MSDNADREFNFEISAPLDPGILNTWQKLSINLCTITVILSTRYSTDIL